MELTENKIFELLNRVQSQYGTEVLKSSKITAIIKDVQTGMPPSFYNILTAMANQNINVKIKDLIDGELVDRDIQLLQLKNNFTNDNGFNAVADNLFVALCKVFGYTNELFAVNTTSQNIEQYSNDKIASNDNITSYSNRLSLKSVKTLSSNNFFTSSDLHIRSNTPEQMVAFLNANRFKGTDTWRLLDSQEMQNLRGELLEEVPFFEDVWCLDEYSKSMSIFNVQEGTHEKDNGKLAQSGQSLPFLAVCELAHSPILDQELGIRMNEDNPWGIKIAHGAFGEFKFSENIADTFNKASLFDKDNWRLPMIEELSEIYQAKETLGIHFKGLVWSSTIERKFFVQVMDFSSGEVVQIKKFNHMDDRRASLFLLAE